MLVLKYWLFQLLLVKFLRQFSVTQFLSPSVIQLLFNS